MYIIFSLLFTKNIFSLKTTWKMFGLGHSLMPYFLYNQKTNYCSYTCRSKIFFSPFHKQREGIFHLTVMLSFTVHKTEALEVWRAQKYLQVAETQNYVGATRESHCKESYWAVFPGTLLIYESDPSLASVVPTLFSEENPTLYRE